MQGLTHQTAITPNLSKTCRKAGLAYVTAALSRSFGRCTDCANTVCLGIFWNSKNCDGIALLAVKNETCRGI